MQLISFRLNGLLSFVQLGWESQHGAWGLVKAFWRFVGVNFYDVVVFIGFSASAKFSTH